MNFELEYKLQILIDKQKLDNAIQLAESELIKIPKTDFHKMIGKSILHLADDLKIYIEKFNKSTSEILNTPKSFLRSVFGKKTNLIPAAYYCEMNGFTINYDKWFISLFSFKEMGKDDWEWLCDFYDCTENDFTITGLEDIQKVFEVVHENDKFNEPNIVEAYEVCEILVILRLQELFRLAYSEIKEPLSKIPMFVTAHDYELIYRVN